MYYSPCKMWIPPIVVVRKVGIVLWLVAWRGLHLSIILILSKAHNLKPLFCLITYPIFKKIKHIIVSYFIFHYVTINSLLAGRTSYIRSSFTSHYVTINSTTALPFTICTSSFTSHYVTINSPIMTVLDSFLFSFTSHYVTINSLLISLLTVLLLDLHPTM